jgi:hypothetical protein
MARITSALAPMMAPMMGSDHSNSLNALHSCVVTGAIFSLERTFEAQKDQHGTAR